MTESYDAIKTVTRAPLRMLVAIENECDAQQAVGVAADLAGSLGATVTLLRVIPPPQRPWAWLSDGLLPCGGAYFDALNAGDGPDLLEDLALAVELLERKAQEELRRLENAFAGPAVSRVAIDVNAGRAIVGWLRRWPNDLVVLAAHRRHALLRLLGATTLGQVVGCGLASVIVTSDAKAYVLDRNAMHGGERDGQRLFPSTVKNGSVTFVRCSSKYR